jgi:hypothetical protein
MTLAAFSVAGLSAAQSDHQKATDENTRATAKTVTVIRCHQWRSEGSQAAHKPQMLQPRMSTVPIPTILGSQSR